MPKLNLIRVESQTAGIRIDDIILFFVAVLFVWSHFMLNKKVMDVEKWIILITLFGIFSFAVNKLLVALNILPLPAKVFYTVRLFEYFIFFYIGIMATRFFEGRTVVRYLFLWNLTLMLLQKFGLAGALTVDGYSTNVSSRVQGIASFPSEMGLLLNLVFCYLVFDTKRTYAFIRLFSLFHQFWLKKLSLYWLFFLFGTFVIFTGNRISILSLIICFLAKLKDEFNWKSVGSLVIIFLLTIGIGAAIIVVISQTQAVYARSTELFTLKNLELIQDAWKKIDVNIEPVYDLDSSESYDMSWWIRIHKWIYVIKVYVSHPICYLQGIGPGFAWSALDGGLLRIFVENGIIGSFFYWKFFSSLYRINRQTKWMMIAFLINMIFFDAYLAYKTMSFMFFGCGYLYAKQKIKDKGKSLNLTPESATFLTAGL